MQVTLDVPDNNEMLLIRNYVKEFVLDDEELQKEQFIIAKNNSIVGFGRLREHNDCVELCTLGVVLEHRGLGIGKKLVNELIKNTSSREIYVVCIIPEYFKKLGFKIVNDYPPSITRKQSVCTSKYIVEEQYCAMCLLI